MVREEKENEKGNWRKRDYCRVGCGNREVSLAQRPVPNIYAVRIFSIRADCTTLSAQQARARASLRAGGYSTAYVRTYVCMYVPRLVLLLRRN